MRFTHTKCGGEIDVKKRQCLRCKKKWDPISFRFDPTGIRPLVDKHGKPKPDKVGGVEKEHIPSIPRWMQYFIGAPYLDAFVSRLPKWPRWVRISVSVGIITGVVLLIVFLR